MTDLYPDDDIQMQAALKEEYERYRAKTPNPLIYELWKACEDHKAEMQGGFLV